MKPETFGNNIMLTSYFDVVLFPSHVYTIIMITRIITHPAGKVEISTSNRRWNFDVDFSTLFRRIKTVEISTSNVKVSTTSKYSYNAFSTSTLGKKALNLIKVFIIGCILSYTEAKFWRTKCVYVHHHSAFFLFFF